MRELNFRILHVCRRTETYGPTTISPEPATCRGPHLEERTRLLARQGQVYITSDLVRVVDDELRNAPRDGVTPREHCHLGLLRGRGGD